jgi:hypothetical protein
MQAFDDFSQHPGSTLLIEVLSRMPRKTLWKSDDEITSLNRSVKILNKGRGIALLNYSV